MSEKQLEEYWTAFDRRAEELGHKLVRDEDGEINHFVLENGFHNGPGCELCHDSWCHHCSSPDDIRPCDGGAAHRAYVEKRDRAELERLKAKYEPVTRTPAPLMSEENVERGSVAVAAELDALSDEARAGKYVTTEADDPAFRATISKRIVRAALLALSSDGNYILDSRNAFG